MIKEVMMNERIGVFVDISNLYYCVKSKFDRKLNYQRYLSVAIGNEDNLFRAYAYGAQIGNQAADFLTCLRDFGYITRYKIPKEFENFDSQIDINVFDEIIDIIGRKQFDDDLLNRARKAINDIKKLNRNKKDTRKADWDVGLTIDVVRTINKMDAVVLGSADSDLAPLVEWIKDQGCRCIVFACNISRELRDIADELIEIDEVLLEKR